MKNTPHTPTRSATAANTTRHFIRAVVIVSVLCIFIPLPEYVLTLLIVAQVTAIVQLARLWWGARKH